MPERSSPSTVVMLHSAHSADCRRLVEVGTRMLANSGIARGRADPELQLFIDFPAAEGQARVALHLAESRERAAWPSDATQIFISRSRPQTEPSQASQASQLGG